MARISDLVADLAARLDIEAKSIATVARHLREEGLISQGARGVNAAQATPLDAARLIIALMVEGKAKDAPQRVRDYGLLRLSAWDKDEEETDAISLRDLYGIDDCTLEEALAAVISGYGDKRIMGVLDVNATSYWPPIICRISDHLVTAQVRIRAHRYYFVHSLQFAMMTAAASGDASAELKAVKEWLNLQNQYSRGIRSTREISDITLWPIGEMLAGLRTPGELDDTEILDRRVRAFDIEDPPEDCTP